MNLAKKLAARRTLVVEALETRTLLSSGYTLPVASGQVTTFRDGDGSLVHVTLTGPGFGVIQLESGGTSRSPIELLNLVGTTEKSHLRISTTGGLIPGTTINRLVIDGALGHPRVFGSLRAPEVDLEERFETDGGVGTLQLRHVGPGATIDVPGNLGLLATLTMEDGSSVHVAGRWNKFTTTLISPDTTFSARRLDSLAVALGIDGATFDIGTGGIDSVSAYSIANSVLSAIGPIKKVAVTGDVLASSVVSNIRAGTDTDYGTLDDKIADRSIQGRIGSVRAGGNIDAATVVVASGIIGPVLAHGKSVLQLDDSPTVWPAAATTVIPLDVVQAVSQATGFDNDHVWIAVFGQLIDTPAAGQIPGIGTTYYLDADSLRPGANNTQEPDPLSTASFTAGIDTPDQPILPSSTLADWSSNLALPIPPTGQQYTGRIVISAGAPVQAQVTVSNGTVSSPSAANVTDPSTGTFWDFLEFTVTNNNGTPNLDMDTSQVDSFGFPMSLQFFQDANASVPYPSTGTITAATNASPIVITSANHGLTTGDSITVSGVTGNTAANGTYAINVLSTNTFQLNGSTGNGIYNGGGSWIYSGAGPVGVEATRRTVFAGTNDLGFEQFIANQLKSGATNAQPFLESYATRQNTGSKPITGATNATPIVITSANHGLATGDVVNISGVGGNTAANGIFTVTVVDADTFQLDGSHGNGAYTSGGAWAGYSVPLRLVSPKDVTEAISSPQSTDPLNNYFNAVIDQFFLKYYTGSINGHTGGGQTFSLVSDASGSSITYSGTVQQVGANGGFVLRLNATTGSDTTNYDIYYPFFSTNLPDPSVYTPIFITGTAPAAPSWISDNNQQNESPSQMVFACDAVFADNNERGFTGTANTVLGDLENSISAAFNRGVALNTPSTWNTGWFPQNGTYNYWVQYWHQDGLAINNQAYAFPYDDKFGSSTNLSINNVGSAKITLGSWGTQAASTTTFTNFPTIAMQSGQVTLTANVAGSSPTGTVTFYIDGVAINSSDAGSSPLPQPVAVANGTATLSAILPALPDGGYTHTYTVTAVYSGDANNNPSIAYQSLQLTGPLGDFSVVPTPSSGPLGTSVAVAATLPSSSGTVVFSISDTSGAITQPLGTVTLNGTTNIASANYTIPTNLLTFTGNTTENSPTVTNVSSTLDLIVNQIVIANGIPANTTIQGFAPAGNGNSATVTLSANAATTATGVLFTSNADKQVYRIVAVFTPTTGDVLTAYGNFTVSAS